MAPPRCTEANVAALLAGSQDERESALCALEAARGDERSLALAAAPALASLGSGSDVQLQTARRCFLLVAKTVAEAHADVGPAYKAAWGDGRLMVAWGSPDSAVARALASAGEDAERLADVALTYACLHASEAACWMPSPFAPWESLGGHLGWFKILKSEHVVSGRVPDAVAELMLDQLMRMVATRCAAAEPPDGQSSATTSLLGSGGGGRLPELAVTGALHGIRCCCERSLLAKRAVDRGLYDLLAAQCHAIGGPREWIVAVSPANGHPMIICMYLCGAVMKPFAGEESRPDIDGFISSGCIDICLALVSVFAERGIAGTSDTQPFVLGSAIRALTRSAKHPGCEAKVRGAAAALAFCLDSQHSLDYFFGLGDTTVRCCNLLFLMKTAITFRLGTNTWKWLKQSCVPPQGSMAAQLCASVFGRDENGESGFAFTQDQIDLMLQFWSQ